MQTIALQISPDAKSAYFADYVGVAKQELGMVLGHDNAVHQTVGPLEYFVFETSEINLEDLMRLSFAQGIYQQTYGQLRPLPIYGDYRLHEDFVFGAKYKGKTNEHLTQLLLNVGLAAIDKTPAEGVKLLDPMCGRGTTLWWAMRYGIESRGIEQDAKALDDIRRNLKKWTKLHRVKHQLKDGFIGKANKKNEGKFLDFSAANTSARIIVGDARQSAALLKKQRFDLIVSDLPYGIQHHTTDKTRNPLEVVKSCIEGWKSCLKDSGAIVLAFNSYQPKRGAIVGAFEEAGFRASDFAAPHRMSESIVRELAIFQKS